MTDFVRELNWDSDGLWIEKTKAFAIQFETGNATLITVTRFNLKKTVEIHKINRRKSSK